MSARFLMSRSSRRRPSLCMVIPPCSEIGAAEFHLGRTLGSGQIFHAMPVDSGWQVLVDRPALYVEQAEDGPLLVETGKEDLARHYFALDHPLEIIYAAFPKDPFSR